MEKIKVFLKNKDNAFITLFLSSFQNLLIKTFNEFKFSNEKYQYEYLFLDNLVYEMFSDANKEFKSKYKYGSFSFDLFNKLITDTELETIDEYIDFLISSDSIQNKNHKFFDQNFVFNSSVFNNINVINKETLTWVVENLEIVKKINPKSDRKISKAMYRFLSWHEYTSKYKILKKFENDNLSINEIIEFWIKIISKVVKRFLNKVTLKKYFKKNYTLKWFWACRIMWVIYWNWISLLNPMSKLELENYYRDRKRYICLNILIALRSYM